MDGYLQPWWCWLVSKTPLWVAPNALTIVGLLVNIVTSLLLLYHAPDAKTDAPRWCYLCCAVGLFIYQSLDAIGMFYIFFYCLKQAQNLSSRCALKNSSNI